MCSGTSSFKPVGRDRHVNINSSFFRFEGYGHKNNHSETHQFITSSTDEFMTDLLQTQYKKTSMDRPLTLSRKVMIIIPLCQQLTVKHFPLNRCIHLFPGHKTSWPIKTPNPKTPLSKNTISLLPTTLHPAHCFIM